VTQPYPRHRGYNSGSLLSVLGGGGAVKRTSNHDPLRCDLLSHYGRNVDLQTTSYPLLWENVIPDTPLIVP
jgi:hypothetical protein